MLTKSFTVYPTRNLVSIHWKGAPSVQDWYDVVERIIGDPHYRRGMNLLTYRDGQLEPVTAEYVRGVLAVLERRADRLSPVSLAVVAPTAVDFGMARMMETLSDTASIVVRAFKRPREAMEWLKNPVPFSPHGRLVTAGGELAHV